MHSNTLVLSSLLGAAAALAAQNTVSLPAHAGAVDGQHAVVLPFGTPHFRTQLLLDAAAIAPNGAVITALRFRAERGFVPLAAASVPNVTVSIGQTSVAIGSMSQTFANNVAQTPTVVFQGTVNLPGYTTAGAGPMPWDIVIPFNLPWPMTTASGNVLVDIVASNAPILLPHYYLDAVQGGGSESMIGRPSDDLMLLVGTGEPRLLSPGNTIPFGSVSFATSSPNAPGALALGLLPQPVPIDLGPLGAPSQTLYVDPIALVPHAWTGASGAWFSSFALPVPNTPTLIGALLYAQSALFDATANALGLVLSSGSEVRIGDQAEALPMQQMDADDPTLPIGWPVDFGVTTSERGATPVLLEGVFY